MRNMKSILFWCAVLLKAVSPLELPQDFNKESEDNVDAETARGRRGVIEEEKFYNIQADRQQIVNQPTPWLPGPLPPEEDPTTKISLTNEVKDVYPLYPTTEKTTDRPTGRGARASNENWVKLPYPNRDDRGDRDDILTPPQPSGELINSRMPRVNFVTQNKGLEASESRHDQEIIQRAARKDDLRTEFVRPDEQDRNYKPVYPRQAVYYPEESRRSYYEDRYSVPDDYFRRDPYYDPYDRRRYPGYSSRIERYDEPYDNYVPRKPKRIIYYAHLPEVVRTPPSVDLRYRYSVDPYKRYDDDMYARTGRYDYRFRNRYPYAPLRKDERNYRDLAPAGTAHKEKKVEEKVTPTAVLPQKEDKSKNNQDNRNLNRNVINSHQYHESADSYTNPSHKAFQDVVRPAEGYFRFEDPLFHGTVEDPYQRKY